jgi:hypothetical protein
LYRQALARSHAAQSNLAVKRLVERAPKGHRKPLEKRLARLLRGSAAAPVSGKPPLLYKSTSSSW